MMTALRQQIDRFFGRGDASVFVPVMDGALKPNERLDTLEAALEVEGVDNLVSSGSRLLASSGSTLLHLDASGGPCPIHQFPDPISALATDNSGRIAVGIASGRVAVIEQGQSQSAAEISIPCPTALLFDQGDLWIASGSQSNGPEQWQRDLMTLGKSGAIHRWDTKSDTTSEIARGLAWPYGLARMDDGAILVSESWRHRLVRLPPGNRRDGVIRPEETPLAGLPGYPARIVPDNVGGFWLAIFAPRNQLIEFVLRETEYRQRMIASMKPEFWIAPCLRSGSDFREPLQGGGVKQMGVLKPWAPTRSYGLVVHLDKHLEPTGSLHSRANGHVHGVTSMALHGRNGAPHLWIGAKGDGVVVVVPEKGALDD